MLLDHVDSEAEAGQFQPGEVQLTVRFRFKDPSKPLAVTVQYRPPEYHAGIG